MKDRLIGRPCPYFDVPKGGKLRLIVGNITKHVFVSRLLGYVAESGFDGSRGCAGINVAASRTRVRSECSVRSKRCEFRGHSVELDAIFQQQFGRAVESVDVWSSDLTVRNDQDDLAAFRWLALQCDGRFIDRIVQGAFRGRSVGKVDPRTLITDLSCPSSKCLS
jgi:hypothetical protein